MPPLGLLLGSGCNVIMDRAARLCPGAGVHGAGSGWEE